MERRSFWATPVHSARQRSSHKQCRPGPYQCNSSGFLSRPATDYYPYQDAQDAWDNEDGPDWEAFNVSYVEGWEAGCDLVFDESPDGYLYDQGEQFSADDCYANEPLDASDADIPYEAPLDPESDGYDLGESDGCISAFELPVDGAFFYGPDGYDECL